MRKESSEIKISVIVPVYNVEKYLEECLDSLINQTFEEFEIICIDDGSTDASGTILNAYTTRDKRIKVVHQENAGLGNARNVGTKHAVGKYICYVDSDDFLKECALEMIYAEAEKKNADVVTFNAEVIYENQTLGTEDGYTNYYKRNGRYEEINQGEKLFLKMVERGEYIHSAWLLFINREWLKSNALLFSEGIFYEDVFFTLNVFLKAQSMAYIPSQLYTYRVRSNSILNEQFNKEKCIHSLNSYLKVYKDLQKYICNEENTDIKKGMMTIGYDIMASIRKLDMMVQGHGLKMETNDIGISYIADELGLGAFGKRDLYDDKLYLTGFNYKIMQAEKIILYGAGAVGKKVFRYLKTQGWDKKVIAFATSSQVCNQDDIEEKPLKCIDEILENPKDVDLIILSAKYSYRTEMIKVLERYNCENIIEIDVNLERIITYMV